MYRCVGGKGPIFLFWLFAFDFRLCCSPFLVTFAMETAIVREALLHICFVEHQQEAALRRVDSQRKLERLNLTQWLLKPFFALWYMYFLMGSSSPGLPAFQCKYCLIYGYLVLFVKIRWQQEAHADFISILLGIIGHREIDYAKTNKGVIYCRRHFFITKNCQVELHTYFYRCSWISSNAGSNCPEKHSRHKLVSK